MFRVFQHRTSGTHFVELFADGVLCFIAALLSAATLAHPVPGVSPLLQIITPAILLSALAFALVMALLYSFVGLYRHRNLGLVPMILRIGFAFVVGGYITYLTIKYIRYEGYASSLVGYSLLGAAVQNMPQELVPHKVLTGGLAHLNKSIQANAKAAMNPDTPAGDIGAGEGKPMDSVH